MPVSLQVRPCVSRRSNLIAPLLSFTLIRYPAADRYIWGNKDQVNKTISELPNPLSSKQNVKRNAELVDIYACRFNSWNTSGNFLGRLGPLCSPVILLDTPEQDTFLLNLLLMSAINGTLVFFQLGLWFYNKRVFIYFACLWTSMYAKEFRSGPGMSRS